MLLLCALAVAALGVGALLDPDVVAALASGDGRLGPATELWLGRYRVVACGGALVLFALGLWVARRQDAWEQRLLRHRQLPARLALAAGALLLALLGAEAALRVADPGPAAGSDAFERHAVAFREALRGQLDGQGYRAPRLKHNRRAGDGLRLLVLGDSMIYGFGIGSAEDTYPAALRRALLARGVPEPLVVFNGGEPGSDTTMQRENLEQLLPRVKPDLVLLGYYPNDVESHAEKVRFYAEQRLLPLVSDNLRRVSVLWRRAEDALVGWLEARGWRPGYFDHLTALLAPDGERLAAHRVELEQLLARIEADDCPAVVVLFPVVEGFEPYPLEAAREVLVETFADLGRPTLDLLPAFAGRDAEPLQVAPYDHHLNAAGARLAAEATADWLVTEGLVPDAR